jgi:hypothetical protein
MEVSMQGTMTIIRKAGTAGSTGHDWFGLLGKVMGPDLGSSQGRKRYPEQLLRSLVAGVQENTT